MPGWIQTKDGFIPKEEFNGNNTRGPSSNVIPDIEPFVSPITGEVITSRPKLREHNHIHGVTNTADYSPEYLAGVRKRREQEQARQGRNERIEILKKLTER